MVGHIERTVCVKKPLVVAVLVAFAPIDVVFSIVRLPKQWLLVFPAKSTKLLAGPWIYPKIFQTQGKHLLRRLQQRRERLWYGDFRGVSPRNCPCQSGIVVTVSLVLLMASGKIRANGATKHNKTEAKKM